MSHVTVKWVNVIERITNHAIIRVHHDIGLIQSKLIDQMTVKIKCKQFIFNRYCNVIPLYESLRGCGYINC